MTPARWKCWPVDGYRRPTHGPVYLAGDTPEHNIQELARQHLGLIGYPTRRRIDYVAYNFEDMPVCRDGGRLMK